MKQKLLKIYHERKKTFYVVLFILLVGGYFTYKKISTPAEQVRYVMAAVERGTLITSISGTGSVSASSQVDLKAKASGDVTYVGVKTGQEVKSGTIVAQLNAKDVTKSLRDATANLESAKLALEKLQKPADTLTVVQAENSLAQAQESKQKYEDDLKKAYDDGFNNISNAFLDLPNVMSGLFNVLYEYEFENSIYNVDWYVDRAVALDEDNRDKVLGFRADLKIAYDSAKSAYDANFDAYKSASRNSDAATVEALAIQTYETTKKIAGAIKETNNLIDYVQYIMDQKHAFYSQIQPIVNSHQSSLDTFTGKTNSHLLTLLSVNRTIQDTKNNIINSGRSIAEKKESLAKIKSGTDVLDLKSSKLSLQQRQNSLQDAREQYANYVVRAPFDGTIAKLSVKKADDIGSGIVVATLVTKQKMAEISLNEVDVAKIKTDQKVMLTFDAVEDLVISGTVAEVDMIGTATQGVISYNVKIGFDVQDDRIKPGMSVSANIILDSKPDVLMIQSSAVKMQGSENYIEQLDSEGVIVRKIVQIGSSNDTMTEVIQGLSEGEEIVSQKISSTAISATAATSRTNQTRTGGGGTGMMMFSR